MIGDFKDHILVKFVNISLIIIIYDVYGTTKKLQII